MATRAIISALDMTEQVQIKKRLEAVQREQADLVGELSSTNQRFGTMNKDFRTLMKNYKQPTKSSC